MPAPARDEVSEKIVSIGCDREALFKRLAAASSRGRLSHAYLFIGPDNKLDMALFMAQVICCTVEDGYPCGNCSACRRVQSYSHPDVTVVFWEQVRSQIHQVREIQGEASLAPREGRRKIYILVDAQMMNSASSNCLLKILEEAPEHAMFILLAPNVFSLLPTIVSRCQRMYVPAVEGELARCSDWSGNIEDIAVFMEQERLEVMAALESQWPVGLGKLEGIVSGARERRIVQQQMILRNLFSSLDRQDIFTLVCWAEKLSGILQEHGQFTAAVRDWEAVNRVLQHDEIKTDKLAAAVVKEAIEKPAKSKKGKEKAKKENVDMRTVAGIHQRREVEKLLRFSGRIVDEMVSTGRLPPGRLREWMDFFAETLEWIDKNLDSTLLLETAFFRLYLIFEYET